MQSLTDFTQSLWWYRKYEETRF